MSFRCPFNCSKSFLCQIFETFVSVSGLYQISRHLVCSADAERPACHHLLLRHLPLSRHGIPRIPATPLLQPFLRRPTLTISSSQRLTTGLRVRNKCLPKSSVSDPHSFNPDPIRIQPKISIRIRIPDNQQKFSILCDNFLTVRDKINCQE